MNVVFEWATSVLSPHSQAGAIDVIAIRKEDGSLSCSPFHVKLGRSARKGEKGIVKMRVNGEEVELSMKLGPAGEAFFVERSRDSLREPSGSFQSFQSFPIGSDHLNSQMLLSPRSTDDNVFLTLEGGNEKRYEWYL